jgi:hypothetical protein
LTKTRNGVKVGGLKFNDNNMRKEQPPKRFDFEFTRASYEDGYYTVRRQDIEEELQKQKPVPEFKLPNKTPIGKILWGIKGAIAMILLAITSHSQMNINPGATVNPASIIKQEPEKKAEINESIIVKGEEAPELTETTGIKNITNTKIYKAIPTETQSTENPNTKGVDVIIENYIAEISAKNQPSNFMELVQDLKNQGYSVKRLNPNEFKVVNKEGTFILNKNDIKNRIAAK